MATKKKEFFLKLAILRPKKVSFATKRKWGEGGKLEGGLRP